MSHSGRADALLADLPRAGRGRLKVFLGAAPGVGKTYAMLQAAHTQLRQGVQVLAGVVETHGRAETEALLNGVPQQPMLRSEYRGVQLEEMDLDGLLAARPKLVLVDELAHSNAPGSRHAKRWQDVQELLAAGIDVYTTVNVQHLESLNDQVRGITGVQVRETVPELPAPAMPIALPWCCGGYHCEASGSATANEAPAMHRNSPSSRACS